MKKHLFFLLTFLMSGFSFSCQEEEKADPCEGVLNEGPLKMVGLLIVDEETGENIIAAGNLDPTEITVTSVHDGKPYKDYEIAYGVPKDLCGFIVCIKDEYMK